MELGSDMQEDSEEPSDECERYVKPEIINKYRWKNSMHENATVLRYS